SLWPAQSYLSRNLGFLWELGPDGLPRRDLEAELLAEAGDFRGEGGADFVVVAELELVASVDLVSLAAGAAEDVHGADVPLGERGLGLGLGRGILGELLDPVLSVADVELLLLEDPLDGADPGAVGASAELLQLVTGAAVHTEVEEDEVRPCVDRVVEDVDALVVGDALGADVGVGLDAHREGLVVAADGAGGREGEIGGETGQCGGGRN